MSEEIKPVRSVAIVGTGSAIVSAVLDQAKEIMAANVARCVSDAVESAPDLEGAHGRAWAVKLDASRARVAAQRGDALVDSTVAVWIVEAPWAHPAWHSYAMVLVHLRPLPGVADALVHLKGATHELHVSALDPDVRRQALISGEIDLPPAMLVPSNFAAQFVAAKDAQAVERVEASVRQIVDGVLSPDTDFRAMWVGLFGGNMIKP